jgi:hypothetical protein
MKKTKSIALILGILIMSLGAGYLAIAWTEPGQAPPAGNVSDPLNVSLTAQSKEGALVLATNSGVTTGLIVQYGKVGIGTTNPQANLHSQSTTSTAIMGQSTDGIGVRGISTNYWSGFFDTKVFVGSSASIGTQTPPATSALHVVGDTTVTGNVGIGTDNPAAKLEVVGNVIASAPTADNHAATKGYVDAQGAGGYLLETRCGWRTCNIYNAFILGSCTPPSCPTGYTDRGTGCYPTGGAYAVSSQYSHNGYQDANCTQGPYSTLQSGGTVGLCYRWCEK